jgi:hypothetical protein
MVEWCTVPLLWAQYQSAGTEISSLFKHCSFPDPFKGRRSCFLREASSDAELDDRIYAMGDFKKTAGVAERMSTLILCTLIHTI